MKRLKEWLNKWVWRRKTPSSISSLLAERQRVEEEKRELEARIDEQQARIDTIIRKKQEHPENRSGSIQIPRPLPLDTERTHLDPPATSRNLRNVQKHPDEPPRKDPNEGKIDLWALWERILIKLNIRNDFHKNHDGNFGSLGTAGMQRTRREIRRERNRLFLLLGVFLLILWGLYIMYLKH